MFRTRNGLLPTPYKTLPRSESLLLHTLLTTRTATRQTKIRPLPSLAKPQQPSIGLIINNSGHFNYITKWLIIGCPEPPLDRNYLPPLACLLVSHLRVPFFHPYPRRQHSNISGISSRTPRTAHKQLLIYGRASIIELPVLTLYKTDRIVAGSGAQ